MIEAATANAVRTAPPPPRGFHPATPRVPIPFRGSSGSPPAPWLRWPDASTGATIRWRSWRPWAAPGPGAHLDRRGQRFDQAIGAMAEVSRHCGTTGFLVWAHVVFGLYLEQSGNPALCGDFLECHARGDSFGGTALSNPMKALSGIESLALRARQVPGATESAAPCHG
ncbi:hypothetical protein [Halomonas sp. E19]|uniref:hypothetical protein n=1 Tax=Halomonas sp. E19 TaxID=3397247 RepID=UPI0040346485